jgi:hypothetical protein
VPQQVGVVEHAMHYSGDDESDTDNDEPSTCTCVQESLFQHPSMPCAATHSMPKTW